MTPNHNNGAIRYCINIFGLDMAGLDKTLKMNRRFQEIFGNVEEENIWCIDIDNDEESEEENILKKGEGDETQS